MPVELPKRNTRTRPVALSIGVLAVSVIATLATLPKDEPAPRMQVVGVVAVRSADPTSTASRVPDPLEIAKKKQAKKKAAPAASSGAAAAAVSAPVTSSGATSAGAATSGATAARSSGGSSGSSASSTKRSSGSSGSSGTSAAEAEFGPG